MAMQTSLEVTHELDHLFTQFSAQELDELEELFINLPDETDLETLVSQE